MEVSTCRGAALRIHYPAPSHPTVTDAQVPQPVALLDEHATVRQAGDAQGSAGAGGPSELVLNLPWGHHSLVLETVKEPESRFW